MRLALVAEVEEELDAAAAWYDDQRVGLGDELLAEVHATFQTILESPSAWSPWPGAPKRVPPVRRILVPRFPYAIAFQALPDKVVILAVAHMKRQPFYWGKRTP